MSGPRRHRPTGLHLRRPAAMVAAVSRRRRRRKGVRAGDGDAPPRPLSAGDPAAARAMDAARRLVDAAKRGSGD
jgi:hypothetical protein